METTRVGHRIRLIRERSGLSQTALARRLHVTQGALSKLERGEAKIDADLLPVIGRVLGVSPAEFFLDPTDDQSSDTGGYFGPAFLAGYEEVIRRLPLHEQRAVTLAADIVDTFLARAG